MHVSATDRNTDGVWGRITRPHQHQELCAPITLLPLRQTRRLWGASVRRCKGGPGEPVSRPARHPSSCGGLERSRHRASLLWGDSGGRAVAAEPCDCCEGCGGCFEGWRPTQDSGGAGCYNLWTDHHTDHSGPGSCQGEWRPWFYLWYYDFMALIFLCLSDLFSALKEWPLICVMNCKPVYVAADLCDELL